MRMIGAELSGWIRHWCLEAVLVGAEGKPLYEGSQYWIDDIV